MSYRCAVCSKPVPSGVPVRRHIVKRPDGNIHRELLVCAGCDAGFRSGYGLADMIRLVGKPLNDVSQAVLSVLPAKPPVAKPVLSNK